MEAYAHQVLNTWSRHAGIASPGESTPVQHGARSLLARSRQSKLTSSGSGILRYEPTGYHIDGGDFTKFFQEAHANTNVTGEQMEPRRHTPVWRFPGAAKAKLCTSTAAARGNTGAVTMTGAPFWRPGFARSAGGHALLQGGAKGLSFYPLVLLEQMRMLPYLNTSSGCIACPLDAQPDGCAGSRGFSVTMRMSPSCGASCRRQGRLRVRVLAGKVNCEACCRPEARARNVPCVCQG